MKCKECGYNERTYKSGNKERHRFDCSKSPTHANGITRLREAQAGTDGQGLGCPRKLNCEGVQMGSEWSKDLPEHSSPVWTGDEIQTMAWYRVKDKRFIEAGKAILKTDLIELLKDHKINDLSKKTITQGLGLSEAKE